MAFRIEPTNRPEDFIDFEVVTNDGTTHDVKLPKNDCLSPETVAKLRTELNKVKDDDPVLKIYVIQLSIAAPEHKDLWKQLAARQLEQIMKHWGEASENDLGESKDSTD
jgi:hypothetical protein